MAKTKTSGRNAGASRGTTPGRPRREGARRRKQLIVDVTLLKRAMAVTGQNQSDTVNEALARLTENVAILEGVEGLRGAFPDHPDHARTR